MPIPSVTRPPEISFAVAEAFASTAAGRNVTGETSVPSSIRSVRAASAGSTVQASSACRAGSRRREVVIGAEEGLDPVLLARLCEREPVLPRHALLPFDHQRDAHAGILLTVKVEGLVFAGSGSSDHAGAARFFADVLGVDVEVTGDVRRLSFPDGTSVGLVPPDHVEPPCDTLLGLLVDDVEAAARELVVRGIAPDGELQAGYGFRYLRSRAPDGRRLELLDRRV